MSKIEALGHPNFSVAKFSVSMHIALDNAKHSNMTVFTTEAELELCCIKCFTSIRTEVIWRLRLQRGTHGGEKNIKLFDLIIALSSHQPSSRQDKTTRLYFPQIVNSSIKSLPPQVAKVNQCRPVNQIASLFIYLLKFNYTDDQNKNKNKSIKREKSV